IDPAPYTTPRHEIIMVMRGHWRLSVDGGVDGSESILAPGDTAAVPPGAARALTPSMSGEASLFRVRNTDDAPGSTWTGGTQ
ncbi:MAG: cupin, partial [Pseudomonadota bacterium]